MIKQNQVTQLFRVWKPLTFSKLLTVKQFREEFVIEFVIDESQHRAQLFLKELRQITTKKHPSGSVSFIGFWEKQNSSQYRKYRIDFIDPMIKEKIDEEKLTFYFKSITECCQRSISII